MAIPIHGILEMRARCPVHLQAEILEATPPTEHYGRAILRVRAVRIFRGDVRPGDIFTLAVRVRRRDVPDGPMPIGDFHYEWRRLEAGKIIEACLRADPEGLVLPYNSCSKLLDAPTDAPTLELPSPRRSAWTRLRSWLGRA